MTQFLTKAQGMPSQIEDALVKIIRSFIWDESTAPPTIVIRKLYASKEQGGISLLNIPARNKAIDLTWLRAYLNLSPSRPSWAFVTDAIINHIHPDVEPGSYPSHFSLTSWSPPTRGHRAKTLPPCVLKLIKTAKAADLAFAPMKLSKCLKLQLPAWFHMGAPPRTYHKSRDECLKRVHKISKVRNLVKFCKHLRRENTEHAPWHNCQCEDCKGDRAGGCKDPHKCASTAEAISTNLSLKFNLTAPSQKDGLTLTHRRLEKNARANVANGDELIFNPSVTTRTNLSDCFRIFATKPIPSLPALRLPRDGTIAPLTIFTDGSCLHNGQHNATCGAGIWLADGHPLNKAIRVPGPAQSNQTGEIAAVVVALQASPPSTDLTIITDSRYVIQSLTHTLDQHEDSAWVEVPNAAWLKAAAYHLRKRSAPTRLKWVKGHSGTTGNEEADKLAAEGANKPAPDDIDLTVPPNFNPTGLRLSTMTQASAYAFVRNLNPPPSSNRARINLERTRATLVTDMINKREESNSHLWLKCRHPDIRRPVQTFLYKALHGAFRIGNFWNDIPQYEQRAHCASCNESPESLDHILIDCENAAISTIWRLARQTWPTSFGPWPDIQLSLILGCGSIALPHQDDESKIKRGPSRLLRILVSESAHLIWVLRCERTIQGLNHSIDAIKSRWRNKINQRITLDRHIATTYNRKPITQKLVKSTWQTALLEWLPSLEDDWVTNLEVLVGITLTRSPT